MINDVYGELISFLSSKSIAFSKNVPLSEYSGFKIGGTADIAVFPSSAEQTVSVLQKVCKMNIRHMTVGNGSNLLFDDSGYRGVVVFTKQLNSAVVKGQRIIAEAGASLSVIAAAARDASLTGLEFAWGIPGSCGGAVCMNAGAYGGQISDVLTKAVLYDAVNEKTLYLTNSEMCFSYRESIVQRQNGLIVLEAEFGLEMGNIKDISDKMSDLMQRRISKQPLKYPSAGSVFKRPAPELYVGKMIEESGLKGYSVGGAQVSEKHAGFIINKGGATSADVLKLIEHIKNTIFKNYGVELQCEIKVISASPMM